MSEKSATKACRTPTSVRRVLVGVLIAAIPLLILVGPLFTPVFRPYRHQLDKCDENLKHLWIYLNFYAIGHGGKYPTPEKWCDLLVADKVHLESVDPRGLQLLKKALRCPNGADGPCHYAMNPDADPCSAPDTVLLFESGSGWNQAGGPELLTTEHHDGRNVLFVDATGRFVKSADLAGLKWTVGASRSPEVPNARRPQDDHEFRYWLENAVWHHHFTTQEIRAATGLTEQQILATQKKLNIWPGNRPVRQSNAPLLMLPYPGGRHPRIGFLEGAVDPQRETKLSVFTPWDLNSYVVVDVPEAIWSNLGLTCLAHTHIDTIWTQQGIALPKLEWNRRPDGSLDIERTLPNGIAFGVKAVPARDAVRMEMWLKNGTDQRLTDLRVQMCVMTKMAAGFAEQTNKNKVFTNPYVACRSADGKRWIITAWEGCHRPWGNEQCPCFHSDPKFPDLEPGQRHRLRGWLSFYEGDDVQAEFARIEATGWRTVEK